jgi:hypothetical protein
MGAKTQRSKALFKGRPAKVFYAAFAVAKRCVGMYAGKFHF